MHDKLFEAALGIKAPWAVSAVNFDEAAKALEVGIDFKPGSRFAVVGHEGFHPVHDTVIKRYRHLNFFQHECVLQVRTPRVKLPDGSVRLLHDIERELRERALAREAGRAHRLTHGKPLVQALFEWVDRQLAQQGLLPSNPLTKALAYVRERRASLQVPRSRTPTCRWTPTISNVRCG